MSRGLKLLLALFLLKRRGGRRVILLMTLIIAWAAVSGYYTCALPGRPAELHCAVIRNTGFAHLTRGMNMDTIAALKEEAKPEKVPHLKAMLLGKDRIAAMTAAAVLKDMGTPARNALAEAHLETTRAGDTSRAHLIAEYGGLPAK